MPWIEVFDAVAAARNVVGAQWGAAIPGVFALAAGLTLLIWPRKSNEIMWKVQQGVSPRRQWKAPFGVTIAMGCLFVFVAFASFFGVWESYQS